MSEKRILLATPGFPHWQERFWNEIIVDLGLEPFTQTLVQVNAKWDQEYPAELLKRLGRDGIVEEQEEWTQRRINSGFHATPYKYAYLDYEPDKPGVSAWKYLKWQHGYEDLDGIALGAMAEGCRMALPKETELASYNEPQIPTAGNWDASAAFQSMASYREHVSTHFDWIWQGGYPSSDPVVLDMTNHESQSDLFGRTITGNRILSMIGQDVRLGVWFRPFHDTSAFHAMQFDALGHTNTTDLCVWARAGWRDNDARSLMMLAEYKQRFIENLGSLQKWLES